MAIAGGATTAYSCFLEDDTHGRPFLRTGTSIMIGRSVCKKPKIAVLLLRRGERVVIAGSDLATVREMLK